MAVCPSREVPRRARCSPQERAAELVSARRKPRHSARSGQAMNPAAAEIWTDVKHWPTWQRDLWLGSIIACALILLPMTLWPWLIFGVTVGVAMVLAVRVHRLRSQLAHADAMITRLAGENAAAVAADDDWPQGEEIHEGPRRLRIVRGAKWFGPNVVSLGGPGDVPQQRDGAHDEIPQADESWLDQITKPGGWT